ncbi:hypothetical protein SCLCIDRAFT_716699 [Scleroderma citrinum Foug A]|uniref:Uncharacterized protein n=1 Tax=Scleroderma citrinum Foug A TaxID=1036808 RepID=A0A0C3AXD9_9AGAM|nr:hypothetical protein SCLCIDRAFT_716699 [Scleroderma citrinum Foug A]
MNSHHCIITRINVIHNQRTTFTRVLVTMISSGFILARLLPTHVLLRVSGCSPEGRPQPCKIRPVQKAIGITPWREQRLRQKLVWQELRHALINLLNFHLDHYVFHRQCIFIPNPEPRTAHYHPNVV